MNSTVIMQEDLISFTEPVKAPVNKNEAFTSLSLLLSFIKRENYMSELISKFMYRI